MKYMHMISRERGHSEGQGGGGERPFGTFQKVNLFWYRHPSPISKGGIQRCLLESVSCFDFSQYNFLNIS